MAKLPNIVITENEDLRKLMAYEFYHDSGTKLFDPSQCEKYLNRLTRNQKFILSKSNIDELTSFVVFGDGVIEQKMGGSYVYDDDYKTDHITPKINSINTVGSCKCGRIETITAAQAVADTLNLDIEILPNASFAIFHRKSRRNVELLFYTRFFVINYYMLNNCAIVSRYLVKELNVLLDKPSLTDEEKEQKKKLKENIFKCMQKVYTVFCSCSNYPAPEGSEPQLKKIGLKSQKKFKYYLSNTSIDSGTDVPYISIVDNSRNPIWWMQGGSEWNTIHGTLFTKGCWMIFRNFTYDYDTGGAGTKKNYSYYEFLRLFAGMQYNLKNNLITFPEIKDRAHNSWDHTIPITWEPNIAGKPCGSGTPWASLFFFKRIDTFTPEDGDDDKFVLR